MNQPERHERSRKVEHNHKQAPGNIRASVFLLSFIMTIMKPLYSLQVIGGKICKVPRELSDFELFQSVSPANNYWGYHRKQSVLFVQPRHDRAYLVRVSRKEHYEKIKNSKSQEHELQLLDKFHQEPADLRISPPNFYEVVTLFNGMAELLMSDQKLIKHPDARVRKRLGSESLEKYFLCQD